MTWHQRELIRQLLAAGFLLPVLGYTIWAIVSLLLGF